MIIVKYGNLSLPYWNTELSINTVMPPHTLLTLSYFDARAWFLDDPLTSWSFSSKFKSHAAPLLISMLKASASKAKVAGGELCFFWPLVLVFTLMCIISWITHIIFCLQCFLGGVSSLWFTFSVRTEEQVKKNTDSHHNSQMTSLTYIYFNNMLTLIKIMHDYMRSFV